MLYQNLTLTRWVMPAILFLFSLSLTGCTNSPLGSNEISGGNRQITGKVVITDHPSAEDAFVWLEGFNVGTRTDAEGKFTLALPAPQNQNSQGGINGIFKLYAYVANYALDIATTVIKEGEFVYSKEDIGAKGELKRHLFLAKKFEVDIVVFPPTFNCIPDPLLNLPNFTQVTLSLKSISGDPVTAILRKPGQIYAEKFYLKNIETREIYLQTAFKTGSDFRNEIQVSEIPHSETYNFELSRVETDSTTILPPGDYELFPYFLVVDEAVPVELIESIGDNVESPDGEFFKIPAKRSGAPLHILCENSDNQASKFNPDRSIHN